MNPHIDDDESELIQNCESDKCRENLFLWAGFIVIIILAIMIALGLASCTINQNMTLSDGDKSGNLKDSTETTAEPSTNLSVPIE